MGMTLKVVSASNAANANNNGNANHNSVSGAFYVAAIIPLRSQWLTDTQVSKQKVS